LRPPLAVVCHGVRDNKNFVGQDGMGAKRHAATPGTYATQNAALLARSPAARREADKLVELLATAAPSGAFAK
jgi:hypothetical protein